MRDRKCRKTRHGVPMRFAADSLKTSTRIALGYALAGSAYILGSDRAFVWLPQEIASYQYFQTLKGLAFIQLTALALWIVLRRALRAMDRRLEAAWAQRAPDTPLKSAEQALILASIVEKETGRAEDRAQIAGVFSNRLRAGMLLQTDPTVIYGLGEKFDGNLRKRDLQADTPYNTYTRAGLPPTAIAMPGRAALLAAVQPAQTKALYFVARGDGSSHFSATLDEHNRAVNKYQRGQK